MGPSSNSPWFGSSGRPFVSRALWSRWCKDPQTSKRRWVQEEGPAADGDLNQILMVNFAPKLNVEYFINEFIVGAYFCDLFKYIDV